MKQEIQPENNQSESVASQPAGNKKSKTLVIIIIAAIVALGLIGGGLFLFKDTVFPVRSVTGKVLSAKCRFNDPNLCRFLNNFTELKDISAISTSTINGKKAEIKIEIQGDDKTHMVTSADGKEEANYISIGNTTYMKDYTDNKWWKSVSQGQDASSKPEWKTELDKSLNDSTDKTTYKYIAKEACDKLTCYKYEVVNPTDPSTKEYVWFDTKQYLIRKDSMESKDGVTETTFSYGNTNIAAPSSTKDMNSPEDALKALQNGQSVPGATGNGGLTPEQIQQLEQTGGTDNSLTVPQQ